MKKSTITKVGITLACATLLSGVVSPVAVPAFQNIVHAEETNQQQPISVLIGAISEVDGPLSHYYVTINPGETKTVEAPKVDGYKLDQYTSPTYEITYDQALKKLNSAGMVWVQFWMVKDTAPETPVNKPVEQPTETPVDKPVEQPTEKPVEKPTDQPTEKPTDTSLLAGTTASKAQPVATTDKKKVDNSTPSTNAIKPQEGSQATAKTLPKTGDSSSMLLVLGGLLSGLSGLGLAATSRKRD